MKAIVYTRYGPPDVLQFKEVAMPAPADNQVLVKICAASVNPSDSGLVRGAGRLTGTGLLKPYVAVRLLGERYLLETSGGSERFRSLSHSTEISWLAFLGAFSSTSGMKISRPACAVMRVVPLTSWAW